MQRKFRISVDGKAYDVVVEEIGADLVSTAPVGAVASAAAAPPPPVHSAPQFVAAAGDEVAPLAGVVQSIDVQIGQTVAAGDKIATIEAMKMKTEVFAKGAGKVVSIKAKAGESIDTGGVLLTLG